MRNYGGTKWMVFLHYIWRIIFTLIPIAIQNFIYTLGTIYIEHIRLFPISRRAEIFTFKTIRSFIIFGEQYD